MSAVITGDVVRRQLAAMSGERFDVGVLRPDGRMLLRENWTPDQINWRGFVERTRTARASMSDKVEPMRSASSTTLPPKRSRE